MNELLLDEPSRKRWTEIESEGRAIQAQLEGCFRQLYQGSQQVSILCNVQIYKSLFDVAKELMGHLHNLHEEATAIVQSKQTQKDSPEGLS